MHIVRTWLPLRHYNKNENNSAQCLSRHRPPIVDVRKLTGQFVTDFFQVFPTNLLVVYLIFIFERTRFMS